VESAGVRRGSPPGADELGEGETMSEDTIRERVELGIRYLSNAYGGVTGLDWLSKVVGPVEMGSNDTCVLGYVAGDFGTSPLVITFGLKQASEWGFYLTTDDLNEGLTYDMLTEAWERRLADLKSKRADVLLARAYAGLDDSWREDA